MSQDTQNKEAIPVKSIWTLFLGSLVWIPISLVLGLFDKTTELFPAHENVDQVCLALSAIFGVLACSSGVYLSRKLSIVQRIMLPLVILFEFALGIFMVTSRTASIVEGRLDFPAGKTHSRQVLMQISRAYQTHGKSSSQYIQTIPFWSNLEITGKDFDFMRNHRRPGDDGHDRDEISSRGYFCAKVTIEETDKAVRILHAGSEKLPEGTVIFCPVQTSVP